MVCSLCGSEGKEDKISAVSDVIWNKERKRFELHFLCENCAKCLSKERECPNCGSVSPKELEDLGEKGLDVRIGYIYCFECFSYFDVFLKSKPILSKKEREEIIEEHEWILIGEI